MANPYPLQSFQPFQNCKSEMYLYGSHAASVPAGWSCRRHLHHMMFEINLVLSGTQLADIGGEHFRQQEDSLLLVPPMLLHSFQAEDPLSYFVLHVQIDDLSFLQQLGEAKLLLLSREHPLNRLLRPEMRTMMNLLREGATKTKLFHTLYGIMNILESYMKEHLQASGRREPDPLPVRIAKEIESLVAMPLNDDHTIAINWMEAIAIRLGFSRRHCYRVFHEAYRMSPRDYLAVLRQQEAMQLLANGNDPVERIAHRIGYDNVQSFIRQFVKWTGMTPGNFRKQRFSDTVYLTPLELKPIL